jgi:hypothetical protein
MSVIFTNCKGRNGKIAGNTNDPVINGPLFSL